MRKWDAAKCIRHMYIFRAPHLLLFFLPWLLSVRLTNTEEYSGLSDLSTFNCWWKSRVVCPFCHPLSHPTCLFLFYSKYKNCYYLRDLWCRFLVVFCLLESDWKVLLFLPSFEPPENWQSCHSSDISKQLRLFLPTPSCSLNLFNPVECKLIYREKGTRPGLAAAARNVRVGKMINTPATEKGRDMARLNTTIGLFNVQR